MFIKGLSVVVLLSALLASVAILGGAALPDAEDAARRGSLCPGGEVCTHEIHDDAPALVSRLWRRAEISVGRKMAQFERELMLAAGVPEDALR